MTDDLEPIAPEAAVELYLEHREGEISEESAQSHGYRLKQFVEWCDEKEITNLNDLTGRQLHAYRVERREDGDLSLVSLKAQLSTLRVFLKFCASIDAVPEELPEKVMVPTVPEEKQTSYTKLGPDRADEILDYLSQYHYASRRHVIFALLWKTGMRTGTLRALDVGDYDPDDLSLDVNHRPDQGTPLKNGTSAERMIALSDRLGHIVDSYLEGPRHEVEDENGRKPLVTTAYGRPAKSTFRDITYRLTRPCDLFKECPHDREISECEATDSNKASRCPSSKSPHELRSGAITMHLLDEVPTEVVSERMDVSQSVLDRHYDRRSEREKMEQRRKYLPGK